MITIDMNKVIAYSKNNCTSSSRSLCATYVKNAFAAGGCTYVSGNGWDNQNFCRTNGFKCIGDFVPVGYNPRNGMQFPDGYKQQTGDICLIKHGKYGHICYATGNGINDWVSDYFQRPPGQMNGTGPYCYRDSVTQVQFWRHESMMNGAPVVQELPSSSVPASLVTMNNSSSSASSNSIGESNMVRGDFNGFGEVADNGGGLILGTHMRQR